MVDAHCHLADSQYTDEERQKCIEEAKAAGVSMISLGTTVDNCQETVKLAEKNANVWACVGIHPEEILNLKFEILNQLKNFINDKKVIGIGETGLDFFGGISEEEKERQKAVFTQLIGLARETNLPIVVHNRNADKEIMEMLSDFPGGVMLHSFGGRGEYLETSLTKDWVFSLGSLVTYKNKAWFYEIVKRIPLDRLLLETDSPYSAPEPIRGSLNHPVNVKIIAESIATLKGINVQELEQITDRNVRKLFNKIK